MRRLLLVLALAVALLPAVAPPSSAAEPTWKLQNQAAEADLAGFSVGESITPGQPLRLKVDGKAASVRVDIFRMGHYGGAGAKLVAQLPSQALKRQPACTVVDRTVDCGNWSVTHTVATTGWEPGLYFAKLIDNLGRDRYVPTIVRSTSFSGKVTLMSSTATHAAYNTTGGHSLYVGPTGSGHDRAHTVSLNRSDRGNGADKIFRYELGLIQYLESLGVPLAYTTNGQLDDGADVYKGARALVTLGHDEYWSLAMRTNLQTLRDRGTNLVFLGSNTMYYRIRWNADNTRVTSYKVAELDPIQSPETTTTFRAEPYANPEARLIGSQYDCDGAMPQTDLVVVNPAFWAFAGTGAKAGSRYPKLIGHEVDKAGPYSPASVHVASHSAFQCSTRQGWSDITYYVAASKAGVFNLGTMGFAYALTPGITYPSQSVAFAKKVIANVITSAAAGPLGNRHTAAANYKAVYPDPKPPTQPPATTDPYTTPGQHTINGRRWNTTCSKYSSTTERCRTDIWATTVTQQGSRFVVSNGWVFNNLTYKPSPRAQWKGNPLGTTGSWTATDGRRWRTECDTAATGRGGCRSYIWSTAIATYTTSSGARAYRWENAWRFNNIVRFS